MNTIRLNHSFPYEQEKTRDANVQSLYETLSSVQLRCQNVSVRNNDLMFCFFECVLESAEIILDSLLFNPWPD